jgi:hypothetical protein
MLKSFDFQGKSFFLEKINTMKKLATLFFLICATFASAQDYTPFNSGTVKFFQSNQFADSTYGFSIDSLTVSGNDSLFFPYNKVGEIIPTDLCEFWGPLECWAHNRPIWIGFEISTDNQGGYQFLTNAGEMLTFDFNIQQGDSTLFYQDDEQQFHLNCVDRDTATILAIADSIKYFNILHLDDAGNPVLNSPLHNLPLRIGKELGLIDFIRIDHFPNILEHVTLIGNKSPMAGRINITNADLHDHQPGDIIQYHDYYNQDPGPPWENYSKYIRHHYLERTDTPDSIIYKVARLTFNIDSASGVYDTIFQKYKRDAVVRSAPYDYIQKNYWMIDKRNYKPKQYAGLTLWTHTSYNIPLGYCLEDNCWGPMDYNGPPPEEDLILVCGLGLFLDRYLLWNPSNFSTKFDVYYINYFKKDGVEWGEQIIVGLPENETPSPEFYIYPNPASEILTIKTRNQANTKGQIINMAGQVVLDFDMPDSTTPKIIDISELTDGVYFVRINSARSTFTQKLVKK